MYNLSLEHLEVMSFGNKYFAGFQKRSLIETYEEFIEQLYNDIEMIISDLEETRDVISNSEDSITVQIKNNLRQQGYHAEHGVKDGGHVDLRVQFRDFKWFAEAKKWNGATYIYGGVEQLISRYTLGGYNQTNGGVLIYFFCDNIFQKIDELKLHLQKIESPRFTVTTLENSFYFYTSHLHQTSGLDFKIKFFPVILHFKPNDKSSRKRKKSLDCNK